MKSIYTRCPRILLVAALLLGPALGAPAESPKKKPQPNDEDLVQLSPFCVSGSGMGATVGGAKDARYFRSAVENGEFPHPNTITAEGLFSEHDLPLKQRRKGQELLVLNGEAMAASLVTLPGVRYLAQIGFSSGLDARSWRREPLNLIAVVDKSGSMSGQPIGLVKDCLRAVLGQLGPDDQLSIVLYGSDSAVYLEPLRTTERNRDRIEAAIDEISIDGSTNMEEGLRIGFELARRTKVAFRGRTRLIQFTDERPNVGNTDAESFMGLMEAGSRDQIGQTTIGVGVQFGAELATKVSSVRGGNLFYFATPEEMKKTFDEELDMLVTELAYDLDVTISPARGLRVAGVYGIPGELLKWEGNGNVNFHVSTLFLSRHRGAIYAAFASDQEGMPMTSLEEEQAVATVKLSYREAGADKRISSQLNFPVVQATEASVGLKRGKYLVSEFLGLKAALTAHLTENNQEKAYRLLDDLRNEFSTTKDRSLRKERRQIELLWSSMAQLAGRGETGMRPEHNPAAFPLSDAVTD